MNAVVLFLSLAIAPPIAVLPFRALGDAPKWLESGIAETMVADLRRGHIAVVERSQLEKAAAELTLAEVDRRPAAGAADPATAAKVGKLVGARTIVVGAVQSAGGKLRLTARFVDVESGVVREAATATGPVERIFALQDELVDKLLGRPVTSRPPRKSTPKMVQAYEIYSKSLVASADDEKAFLLSQSVALDPAFVCASDDLTALQKRMAEYSRTSSAKMGEREKALLARAQNKKLAADERLRNGRELLESLAAARRWHTLANLKLELHDLDEELAFRRFQALDRLRKHDEALQAGEQILKSFPTGLRYREVENRMHEVVEQRRKMASRRAEYQKDLDDKRASAKGLEYDFAPCIVTRWNSQIGDLMLENCTKYLEQHGRDADPAAQEHNVAARFFVILALDAKGEFARARPLAEKLIADSDEWDEELRKLMSEWPTDD
jgi:TolB-like protein